MITNARRKRALKALTHAIIVSILGESPDRSPDLVKPEDVEELEADLLQRGLDMVVMGSCPDAGLRSLHGSGILQHLIPEFNDVSSFGGRGTQHKDLWRHTLQVVKQSPPNLTVRWAAVFHDVGKPKTIKIENDKVSFHGHEQASARVFTRVCETTVLFPDREFRDRVVMLITNLGQVEQYRSTWTDSAVRRLHLRLGDSWEDLLDLGRADVTTKHDDKRERLITRTNELSQRARELARKDKENRSVLPKGIGDVIIKRGCRPGRMVGEIRGVLEARVRSGDLERSTDLDYYKPHIELELNRRGISTQAHM